jgi:hypothetical protein
LSTTLLQLGTGPVKKRQPLRPRRPDTERRAESGEGCSHTGCFTRTPAERNRPRRLRVHRGAACSNERDDQATHCRPTPNLLQHARPQREDASARWTIGVVDFIKGQPGKPNR